LAGSGVAGFANGAAATAQAAADAAQHTANGCLPLTGGNMNYADIKDINDLNAQHVHACEGYLLSAYFGTMTVSGDLTVDSIVSSQGGGIIDVMNGRLLTCGGQLTSIEWDTRKLIGNWRVNGSLAVGSTTTPSGDASFAQGAATVASGQNAFASGQNAWAERDNSYVWSDGTTMHSPSNMTFTVCASNGIYLLAGTNTLLLGGVGSHGASGGSSGGLTLNGAALATSENLSALLALVNPLTLNNANLNGITTIAMGNIANGTINGDITGKFGGTAQLTCSSKYHDEEIATVPYVNACDETLALAIRNGDAILEAEIDSLCINFGNRYSDLARDITQLPIHHDDLATVTGIGNETRLGIKVNAGDLQVNDCNLIINNAGLLIAQGGAYVHNLGDIQMGSFQNSTVTLP
ncbi:MAG: hypothetical protein WCI73_16315, partial [Phycisphaerae bacterium]